MPMCDACQAIEQHKRRAPGHDALEKVEGGGVFKPFAQAAVLVTHHVCRTCGTKWKHEDDKNDAWAGWSTRD